MSFFGRVYYFKDWYGVRRFWTAKKIYKRVMRDADTSNYNWITSATELVKLCKKADFPEHYSTEIKLAILRCFIYLENEGRWRGYTEPTDDDAVHYCYNTLTGAEEFVNAKREYFKIMIRKSSLIPYYKHSFYIKGATYLKLQEEWRKKKLDEFVSEREIDFEQLMKDLEADFNQTIKMAEEAGLFKDDDEKWHQEIQELFATVIKARGGILY